MRVSPFAAFAGFAGATAAAAVLGSIPTKRRIRRPWYALLRKPKWQPPRWVFGPVWTALYTTIAISGFTVWRAPQSQARTRALGLWATQLGLNAAWPWAFFGAKSPGLGFANIVMLAPAIGLYAREAHRVSPAAGWLVAPYLVWTSFATVLNGAILEKNA